VLNVDEQAWCEAFVALIHQNGALLEQRLEPLQHDIDGGIEQRVTGRDEFGLRFPCDERLVEGDAGVAVEHRVRPTDQAIAVLEDGRDTEDLEAALLALREAVQLFLREPAHHV
jgi:hypothetical protein